MSYQSPSEEVRLELTESVAQKLAGILTQSSVDTPVIVQWKGESYAVSATYLPGSCQFTVMGESELLFTALFDENERLLMGIDGAPRSVAADFCADFECESQAVAHVSEVLIDRGNWE